MSNFVFDPILGRLRTKDEGQTTVEKRVEIRRSGSANPLPDGGSVGQVLTKASIANYDVRWSDQTGGGAPGGANTEVQFNNNGAFAGNAAFTYDSGTGLLTVGLLNVGGMLEASTVSASTITANSALEVFDGTNFASMLSNSLTTSREYEFPDTDGFFVIGPSSRTDNAILRWDGTAGLVQNSGVTIDDNNVIAAEGLQITDNAFNPLQLTRFSNDANGQGFRYIKGRGTAAVPAAVLSGDQVARFMATGYVDDAGVVSLPAAGTGEDFLEIKATEAWSTTNRGRSLELFTVTTGASARTTRLFVDGSGNVGIGKNSSIGSKVDIAGDLRVNQASNVDGVAGYSSESFIWSLSRQASPSNGSLAVSALGGIGFTGGVSAASTSYQVQITSAGNVGMTGYLRVGSLTAPTNTTAGDLTSTRLKVGNGAFGTGVEFSVTGDGALSGFLRVGSETAPTNTTAGDLTFVRGFMTGNLSITDANIVLSATTGTKIGTATTEKLSFWNATPVVQNTGWAMSNVTPDKVLDANATTLDEVADVLGTLIDTLKTYGLLGA